jgi:signal transduction histidine kinase
VLQLGEQQEHLVDALLTLASGQSGLRHRKPFDLAEVTSRVVASRRPDADRQGVRVAAVLVPAVATGDSALAESLVANLVDNAVRHNGPGGDVQVTTGTHLGRPRFSVANSGPVVPPGEVGRLLEPFQQLGGERTRHDGGHGLGMAIVAAVARAHAADLAVRARPEGGLDVTVTFRS